nr:hypothetical protein [Novosphingobium panipatense]
MDKVHEDLRALARSDEAWAQGQRELARIVSEWRALPHVAPVLTALDRFGRGTALEACAPLAALFGADGDPAGAFVDALMTRGVTALADLPLGQMPFRHAHRQEADTLLLAHSGTATLALAVYDGESLRRQPEPRTVQFAPMEVWWRVLSGSGRAERIACPAPSLLPGPLLPGTPVELRPGTVLHRDGAREAIQIRGVEGSLVILRLQRLASLHEPVRAFALADGALQGQSAPTAEFNRLELAMAVLVGLGRQDAVPVLSRIAHGTGPAVLRWQALRAILAMDTRAGLVLLGAMAAGEDGELAQPARDLHRALVAQWPELEKVAQWRG